MLDLEENKLESLPQEIGKNGHKRSSNLFHLLKFFAWFVTM